MSDKNSNKPHHTTPSTPVQETLEDQQPPPPLPPSVTIAAGPTFLSPPPVSSELLNPKRPRYTSGQWKLLPSPTQKQNPTNLTSTTTASSSDTASSPSQSPRKDTTSKPEVEHQYTQLRKGKYVSPVWKPNEMLWLARAWRIQYQGGSSGTDHASKNPLNMEPSLLSPTAPVQLPGRGKTRAAKDQEVAEYLNRNGVNRDAKTAGTKWDNMLGEFRKVYEWERGGEREHIGKSYFRLSPYERKLHRLPASFDEEVFQELAQFMGPRMRTPPFLLTSSPSGSGGQDSRLAIVDTKSFPYSPLSRDDDIPLSYSGTEILLLILFYVFNKCLIRLIF
ncbi:uncharacterized protein LOC143613318 [Bidens hawaiensis]|uniref:uncharacterized protein LOC143613318 n=1 Tax=Bidens hawaiensis TaxID=980011 RepID=UPI0040497510